MSRDTYTAPSGLTAQIMEFTSPGDQGPTCKAVFSLNGIPAVITASDGPEARADLLRVLDAFVIRQDP